jgi:hypothetical protein
MGTVLVVQGKIKSRNEFIRGEAIQSMGVLIRSKGAPGKGERRSISGLSFQWVDSIGILKQILKRLSMIFHVSDPDPLASVAKWLTFLLSCHRSCLSIRRGAPVFL